MITFIARHSLLLMALSALAGFAVPEASQAVFPVLPYVLFFLMTLTLLGINQRTLISTLKKAVIWKYALYHSFGLMIASLGFSWLINANSDLTLAIVATAATGSLFATPAIVRAIGFDSMTAMAMTIATTLLLPLALYLTLFFLQTSDVTLDLQSYLFRLLIFIFGPMLFSFLVHQQISQENLLKIHQKIAPYTIILVFSFPFGLVGDFRLLWDTSPYDAYWYFLVASALCFSFFLFAFLLYRKQGTEAALIAAVTAGNRNVLLTYTIAGSLLGPAFLPLAGAIQAPTYCLPILTKCIARFYKTKNK